MKCKTIMLASKVIKKAETLIVLNFQHATSSIKSIMLFLWLFYLLLSNYYIALEISPFCNCHLIINKIYNIYICSNYSYHRKRLWCVWKSVVPFYRSSGGVSRRSVEKGPRALGSYLSVTSCLAAHLF